jgi:hypothetical protein
MARKQFFPTTTDPVGICDFDALDAAIEAKLAETPKPDLSEFWRRGGPAGDD